MLGGALSFVPGIVLLLLVGFAGKLTETAIANFGKAQHMVLPNIEYVLWAIIYGLILTNFIGLSPVFKRGIDTYDFWLKLGIVFEGSRFLLGDVLRLGTTLLFTMFILAFSICFMTLCGRYFGLSEKLTSLLAVGSSICGVSAIIAAKGVIDAEDEEVSCAIGAILVLGAISLIAFPFIGHALHLTDQTYGLWCGLAVDNTAEAIAAGALYSESAAKYAILAKTMRNQVQDRRGELRRTMNKAEREAESIRDERRFVEAAKTMLPDVQYRAIWEAVQGVNRPHKPMTADAEITTVKG